MRFIPKTLHELCRAQKIDPDDMQRCNYWVTRSGPIAFFQGDIIFYTARWPDGAVARGRFDSAQYCVEVGCVATIEIRRP